MSSQDRAIAYIAQHTTLNLATDGPAGLWAAAVLYVNVGVDLYFTSVTSTRHGQNMVATHHVAGTINDDCTTWMSMKGIQLDGEVTELTDAEARRPIVEAYLRRFPFSVALWHGETDPEVIARAPGTHGFYRITPEHLFFTDNEYAPGRRQEIPLG